MRQIKTDSHAYQREGIKFLISRSAAALFWDVGRGKTFTMLAALQWLKQTKRIRKVLLVGTIPIIYNVWRQEAKAWDYTKSLTFSLVHGTASERTEALNKDADIYLVNYENLLWIIDWLKKHQDNLLTTLVIDESSHFKNPSTKRFKELRKVLEQFERRYILTGTPTPNSLEEIWPQLFLLDGGTRLERSLTRFRERFFVQDTFRLYVWTLKPKAAEIIYAMIQDVCHRLSNKDLEKLPLTENNIKLNLPSDLLDQYRELEREMLLEIKNTRITAVNAGVLVGKCQQFIQGRAYDEHGKVTFIHQIKLDALKDLLLETHSPVLVAYHYKHDLYTLKQAFPEAPYLGGGVSATQKQNLIEQWNRREIPLMFVHPASVGHGINLQYGGHILVWYCMTASRENYDQMIGRLDRTGQTTPVIVHRLVMKNTVDTELFIPLLKRKEETQMDLLDALEKMRVD